MPFALAGADTSEWVLAAALVVRGVGPGAVTLPVLAAAYEGLDRAQVPDASVITRAAPGPPAAQPHPPAGADRLTSS